MDASDATQRALTVFYPSLHILPVYHLGQQRIQVTVDHELWAWANNVLALDSYFQDILEDGPFTFSPPPREEVLITIQAKVQGTSQQVKGMSRVQITSPNVAFISYATVKSSILV